MPAEPKKIKGEKGNKPAIVVLLVDRPFAAELFAKNKPKRADGGNTQRGAGETAVAMRSYGLRLRENGIQSALIISHGPKDESALQKRLQRRFVAALYERRMLCLRLQAFGGRRPLLQQRRMLRRSQTAATERRILSAVTDRRYRGRRLH